LTSDPRRISAELNALFNYLDTLRGPHEHYITLLSSDTGAGWLCTRLLEEFLKTVTRIPDVYVKGEHYVKSIEAVRVQFLGRDFTKGSLNLIAEAKKTCEKTPRSSRRSSL
jgi:putative CRISPR-associated protein (TIGR02619 family)